MKFLIKFVILLLLFSIGVNANNETCDKVLDSMMDSCKAIRATLISMDSLDPKVACCKNARYDLCLQGVKAYVTVARSTRICQESQYEEKMQSLESNVAMQAIKKLCENFDSKACITDSVSSAWSSISETLNPTNLSETISKNFNEAMTSISNFMKNFGSQAQNFGSDAATGVSGLLRQRQQLALPSNNEYTVTTNNDDNGQSSSSSSSSSPFDSITNSLSKFFNQITTTPIEIVPKKND